MRRAQSEGAPAAPVAGERVSSHFPLWWEKAREGFFECDVDGRFRAVNPALARLFGYDSGQELLDSHSNMSVPALFVDPARGASLWRQVQELKAAPKGATPESASAVSMMSDEEAQVKRPDGSLLWTSWSAWPLEDGTGWGGAVVDISREKVAEERLLRHAFHDKTTGLADRNLFMERVATAIRRTASRPSSDPVRFAVLLLDLDRFKVVNDTLGHSAGDQLLAGAARRLEAVLRPSDLLARLGGDEFGIVLDEVSEVQDVLPLLDRIQKRLGLPITIEGQEVFANASIGVALGERDDRAETLLRHAESAMYRAKEKGRNRFEVWSRTDEAPRGANAMQLEAELRRAVERNEFRAFYQPIVSLASGRLIGFEALVRWVHPRRGFVSPGQFIPIAEDTGLIMPIGHWMLRESCKQLAVWQKRGGRHSNLMMSVNLSARQFGQADLVRQIDRILMATGLDGGSLKLEVTESAIMDNPETAIGMLNQLKAYGIKLSLDDFGTGYSSLSYLHRFPFNVLKIDQSFVSQMDASEKNEEIVRTIVALAHTLHMDVIAEGVETESQLDHLRALRCHYGQGYYFAGPLDVESATEMLLADPEW
jgi:diguanylate cyclase (GGDEF)-like protein